MERLNDFRASWTRGLQDYPDYIKRFTGFLLYPEYVTFYWGKTHLAIEYTGPERIDAVKETHRATLQWHDLTHSDQNFIEEIAGLHLPTTAKVPFPIAGDLVNFFVPTNAGHEKLAELKWNFAAEDHMMGLNVGNAVVPIGVPARLVNAMFFDADENGLRTRRIQWIDFVPLTIKDVDDDPEKEIFSLDFTSLNQRVRDDFLYIYPVPEDFEFKHSKLPLVNRFIELAGDATATEPQITDFLSKPENQFILTMAFGAKEVHYHRTCVWQSEAKPDVIPDFFLENADGYGNIVEFKLPVVGSKAVVGRVNRETFSAEINSYVSQTRVYKEYFNDPNNRVWFEHQHGFKVKHPKRILVMGRRSDFLRDEYRDIVADHPGFEIMTYEDMVDTVIAQFYK